MKRWELRLVIMLAAACGAALPARGQSPRVYQANFAAVPPVIDGIETTADEWAIAAPGGDQWLLLSSRSPETSNNRFDAIWDQSGLYIRHQVNQDAWEDRAMGIWDPGYENLNFFFDPNTDGEPNENTDVFGSSTDGYQLAFNQPLGMTEINSTGHTAGSYSEAHVNALFGNQGAPFSGFAGLQMKQTTSVAEGFGYAELFIPWTDFDATDPADGFNPAVDDVGLYHPQTPVAGEQWYFNVAAVQSKGLRIPAWESPPNAFFMAQRPHGILEFVGGDQPRQCDLNADLACDALDIDTLTEAILNGSLNPQFDIDNDGTVGDADRVRYVEVVLYTWFGDSNMDGQFSTQDLVAVLSSGGYEDGVPGNAGWATGDWNGDLDFTTNDFVTALSGGGFEQGLRPPQAGAAAAVPEPCGLLLAGVGALSLLGLRRSR